MLEKPALQDAMIADWLLDHYGLRAAEVKFLPTNYQNTAAYRVVAEDDKSYFLKLRRDVFEETSVTLPLFLKDLGLRQIIAPLATASLQYWAYLDDFNVILYPFVEGHNAFKVSLSEDQRMLIYRRNLNCCPTSRVSTGGGWQSIDLMGAN